MQKFTISPFRANILYSFSLWPSVFFSPFSGLSVYVVRFYFRSCWTHTISFYKAKLSFHSSLQIGEKRPAPDAGKKPKTPKKKKKKDPNEPQKPVSAYALFFRDTQAAIKGQNPNATFGEVSKIVASMWDGLGEEQKQVHECCKHDYVVYSDVCIDIDCSLYNCLALCGRFCSSENINLI